MNKSNCLPVCDAVQSGRHLHTLKRNAVPSVSLSKPQIMKARGGEWSVVPCIIKLRTKWSWVLYWSGESPLGGPGDGVDPLVKDGEDLLLLSFIETTSMQPCYCTDLAIAAAAQQLAVLELH